MLSAPNRNRPTGSRLLPGLVVTLALLAAGAVPAHQRSRVRPETVDLREVVRAAARPERPAGGQLSSSRNLARTECSPRGRSPLAGPRRDGRRDDRPVRTSSARERHQETSHGSGCGCGTCDSGRVLADGPGRRSPSWRDSHARPGREEPGHVRGNGEPRGVHLGGFVEQGGVHVGGFVEDHGFHVGQGLLRPATRRPREQGPSCSEAAGTGLSYRGNVGALRVYVRADGRIEIR